MLLKSAVFLPTPSICSNPETLADNLKTLLTTHRIVNAAAFDQVGVGWCWPGLAEVSECILGYGCSQLHMAGCNLGYRCTTAWQCISMVFSSMVVLLAVPLHTPYGVWGVPGQAGHSMTPQAGS